MSKRIDLIQRHLFRVPGMRLVLRLLARCLLSALVAMLGPPIARADAPRRVASINLCTDQLLLALADPDQIAAVSPFARDPRLSFLSDRALRFSETSANAEDLLARGADLVLLGPHDNKYTRAFLDGQQVPVLVVPPWTGLDDGRAQIRIVAARLGHSERGETLIRAIDDALAAAPRVPAGTTALELERRGYVPGSRTVVADVLNRLGFDDRTRAMGLSDGGFVPLERLVVAPPDLIVVADRQQRAEDQGTALLTHPVLARLFPPARRLLAPARLSICGGPATPALIDSLAAQIREHGSTSFAR
jgi:iron complex transport system substrate-binding protein